MWHFKESLELGAIGIYLVTDGASDHTHDFLLNQLPFLHTKYDHDWRIHTIGWHCSKRFAEFYTDNNRIRGKQ